MTEEHSKTEDEQQLPFDPEPLIDFWTEVAAEDWKTDE